MLASVTETPPHIGRANPWLICLDLQREHAVPGRPQYAAESVLVIDACRQVLGYARDRSWRVVHSQLRREDTGWQGGGLFGAPIEGLRPRISEPVFMRRGLSAFSNPDFAAALRDAEGEDVYLIGFSLSDTCLATALAAVDHSLCLTLVEDAVGVGAAPRPTVAEAVRSILRPFARFVSSGDVAAETRELSL